MLQNAFVYIEQATSVKRELYEQCSSMKQGSINGKVLVKEFLQQGFPRKEDFGRRRFIVRNSFQQKIGQLTLEPEICCQVGPAFAEQWLFM